MSCFFKVCLISIFTTTACLAQEHLAKDTIIQMDTITVIQQDTILTNFLVEVGMGPTYLKFDREFSKDYIQGINYRFRFAYLRQNTWYKTGVDILNYKKRGEYFEEQMQLTEETNFREAIQQVAQVIGTDTTWINIPYMEPYQTMDTSYIDTSMNYTNKYYLIEIPLMIGWIYDRPAYSLTFGGGIKCGLLRGNKSNIMVNGSTAMPEKINLYNISICFEGSFMYYILSELALGIEVVGQYSFLRHNEYPRNTLGSNIKLSYFF